MSCLCIVNIVSSGGFSWRFVLVPTQGIERAPVLSQADAQDASLPAATNRGAL